MIYLPQQILLGIQAIIFLLYSYLSGYEYLNLTNPRGEEYSTGSVARKYFYFYLTIGVLVRAICVVIEVIVFAVDDSCGLNTMFCFIVRYFPDLFYLSSYFLVVLYFAEVYFTIIAIQWWNIENTLFYSLLISHSAIIMFFLLSAANVVSYETPMGVIGTLFMANCFSLLYFSYKVIKDIPVSSKMAKNVQSRLYPVVIVACSANFLFGVYFIIFAVGLLISWPLGYPPV